MEAGPGAPRRSKVTAHATAANGSSQSRQSRSLEGPLDHSNLSTAMLPTEFKKHHFCNNNNKSITSNSHFFSNNNIKSIHHSSSSCSNGNSNGHSSKMANKPNRLLRSMAATPAHCGSGGLEAAPSKPHRASVVTSSPAAAKASTDPSSSIINADDSMPVATVGARATSGASRRAAHRWLPQRHLLSTALTFCILAFLLGAMPAPAPVDGFDLGSELNLKPTKYSEFSRNATYVSSTAYNPQGMQPLYNITHKILWFFIGEDALPDGYIVLKDMAFSPGPKVERNEWGDLVKHYWILILVVLVNAIIIVLMPIIGLCLCLCRCAGSCGGRPQPFDKKHDTCRRVFLGLLLIILATGILFGVIVAFVNNSFMQSGVDGATAATKQGSDDTRTFLTHTADQVEHVLVTNYAQLSNQLDDILKETSAFIISELEQKSMAISLKYLTDFLAKLPDMRDKLKQMKLITNELRVYASQLSDGLRGVKRDLLVMLTKCNVKACQDVLSKYEIGKLDANGIHYDQLPDVTEIIESLEKLINDNIASAGNRGLTALDTMRSHLKTTIAQYTPQIMTAINKAGQDFKKTSNDVRKDLNKVSAIIGNGTDSNLRIADNFLEEYSPYRFYIGIAASSVLLLILICLVAALFCGICGKRPDGYGDDCCNKGSGSSLLMIAVTLIFLTISALAVVALVHFFLGIILYRGVCVPLHNPQNDEVFELVDNSIDLNNILYPSQTKGQAASGTLPPFRISHAIASCKENQTLYEVLRVHNLHDMQEVNDIPTQYKINQTLKNLVDGIDFNNNDIEILSAQDKQRILELGESSLKEYDSGQFIDNLNDTITKHSLVEIAGQLRATANKITTDDMKDVQVSLRNQALHLESYEQNLVIPMKNQSSELIRLAHELDKILRYKERSFQESIPLLVTEIERAQTFINQEGRPFVKATAENLTRYFASEIERYLHMVVNAVEKKIGLCHPLAKVYDAALVSGCNRIVDPLNGFWAGVAWCVLLFLPTILVSIKLASLYQKSDPYPGPLVESEYLYDAYSERDHIPLANGPKNKRRKNKDRRRRDYYEEAVGPTSHGVPPQAAAVRDTRYNDMAPKHWDGGPPRYQNPPMAPPASEYERPPPYYYPGAAEQD